MFNEMSRNLEPLLTLQRAMERAMSRDFFGLATTDRGTFPPISVFKGEHDYLLTAELPGVRKEDINIEVKNDLLRLWGERQAGFDVKEVSVHRRERSSGTFDRTVKLPFPTEPERMQATYENGILTVTLPVAEAAKARKIAIT